jgi:hypothetical protein
LFIAIRIARGIFSSDFQGFSLAGKESCINSGNGIRKNMRESQLIKSYFKFIKMYWPELQFMGVMLVTAHYSVTINILVPQISCWLIYLR